MRCPFCGNENTRVQDSRQTEDGTVVRRRRECEHCLRRFTTFEKFEEATLIVVKKEGFRQEFSRSKIISGMLRACEKRPISTEQIENAADIIEKTLRQRNEREVSTAHVGEAVLKQLFELDEVAYIRFASVYREFENVQRFMEELQAFSKKRKGRQEREPAGS